MTITRSELVSAIDLLILDISEWASVVDVEPGDEDEDSLERIKAGAELRDRLLSGESVI